MQKRSGADPDQVTTFLAEDSSLGFLSFKASDGLFAEIVNDRHFQLLIYSE
jgi:hypothetical protein